MRVRPVRLPAVSIFPARVLLRGLNADRSAAREVITQPTVPRIYVRQVIMQQIVPLISGAAGGFSPRLADPAQLSEERQLRSRRLRSNNGSRCSGTND